ncbi:hypothetical protein Tco_1231501, partial [Tanacetum coccineum]
MLLFQRSKLLLLLKSLQRNLPRNLLLEDSQVTQGDSDNDNDDDDQQSDDEQNVSDNPRTSDDEEETQE